MSSAVKLRLPFSPSTLHPPYLALPPPPSPHRAHRRFIVTGPPSLLSWSSFSPTLALGAHPRPPSRSLRPTMIPRPTRLTSQRPSVAPLQRRFESLTHKEVFSERNPDLPLYALREAAAAGASSSSSTSSSSRLPARKRNTNPLLEYEVPQSDDPLRRTERRSPAAVFGARKMPRISIPSELENKLERLVGRTFFRFLSFHPLSPLASTWLD